MMDIEPADGAFVFPTSFAQQRLWFLDQWEPGSAAYNVPTAMRLRGQLDLDAFERSLNAIVSRHEALRTSFEMHDGQPVQLVAAAASLALSHVDLSTLPRAEREAEARRIVHAEAHRAFDLTRGPLLRATALRLAGDEHVVLLTLHHIVFDGWSMGVFLKELAALYNAFTVGAPSRLPPLSIQYADYTIWQRDWLQGEALEHQLAYWREQLAGPLPVLQLPADHQRLPVMTSRGAHHPVRLSRALADAIAALSRRERVTVFMTLLAAFQTLLSRYSGQEDIVVGTAIAGRNQVELEPLIGFFVNTLALRTDLSGDPTFRELLHRVRDVTLGAFGHQDVPFEKLVEELQPDRSLNQAPLCQAVFVLQNTPQHVLELRALAVEPFPLMNETAKFDVNLSLRESPDGLTGVIAYSSDLFEASTIARMATHFEILLNGICADPDRHLSELPLISAAERRQVIVEWNDTKRPYASDATVHAVFEQQAQHRPDVIAAVCGNESMTFGALNARANRLAHYLRARGVGAETAVGVCLARSIDTVVALLAILKAGGAYVPLDRNDPPNRMGFMLADARVRLIVTETAASDRLPAVEGVERLYLDRDARAIRRERADNLVNRATADSLAYIMYTSGSTGTPKAVAIVHRGVVRLVKEASFASLTPDDVMLHAAPITFDASTFEIWGALLNGARLALVPVEKPSLAELGTTLERHHVTIAWLTSGLFNQMVDDELERLSRVRQVLAGGEVLSVPHVQKFLRASAGTLINGYGPTENTTFSCCYPMTGATAIESSVPIGRPISNSQAYVLDAHLNPLPIGVPGELYVGGDGLARGYWNRPDLTDTRFVPNAFSDVAGARLYKTGDRVRYRLDGNLEFLGRVDHQVKIRGFRVELGEIEAVLARHAAVCEAVAVVREDSPGDKRLVAYVSTREAVDGSDLRRFVGQHLADYMVPSVVEVLEVLPKTSAGKIDRHILPAPKVERVVRRGPLGPPRNDVEAALVALWCGVLHRDQIGIHDNFFELGGHSLLATQVISRIRSAFGTELPLRALFEAPTIAGLASRLAPDGPRGDVVEPHSGGASPPAGSIVALHASGTKTPFFCVHGIGGEAQAFAALAREMDPERPLYGIRLPSTIAAKHFPSIESLAAVYVAELRRTVPDGPYMLGGYSSGASIAYEMAQQLTAAGDEVAMVALLDSGLPNNRRAIEAGPRAIAEWVQNLLWWLVDDFKHARRADLVLRLRSKATLLAVKLATFRGLGWLPHRQPDIRDRLGIPFFSQEWVGFLEDHVKSLMAYLPRAYPGRVTLFRARTQPLFRLHEHDLGWGRMAKGGVDVYVIPGSHESILGMPHVAALGKRMKEVLDAAEKRVSRLPRVA